MFEGIIKIKLIWIECKIIVLTVSVNPEDKERANSYKNAVGFFSKPLSIAVLELLWKKRCVVMLSHGFEWLAGQFQFFCHFL